MNNNSKVTESNDRPVRNEAVTSQKSIPDITFPGSFTGKIKGLGRKKVLFISSVFSVLVLGLTSFYFMSQARNQSQSSNVISIPSPTSVTNNTSPSPTISVKLTDLKTIDTLNTNAAIKVPFIRKGNIYFYEDGKEKLVAKPSRETTQTACFHLLYPLMSPNGRYIAYIEQVGQATGGYAGCTDGILRIVDVQANSIKATDYTTSLFGIYSWDEQNRLRLEATLPDDKVKFAIFDPATNKELVSEVVDRGDRFVGYRGYPLFNEQKVISYKNKKYYLTNPSTKSETLLFDDQSVLDFRGWSPNGQYALFSNKQAEQKSAFDSVWYAVDTNNLNVPKKEVIILHGAAGGDFSTGNKWYFNKAFISYCSQDLSYLDGTKPLELTNSGGGGCHNEEGFVATSPNGNYAFVKFSDRFELHTQDGDKQIVKETTPLPKDRDRPKNLIWLNNDYMIMFERTSSESAYGDEKPTVYIYDRQNNTLKLLIEDAYLIEISD